MPVFWFRLLLAPNYRQLMRENQRIVARADARLRSEIRRERKHRGVEGEALMEATRVPVVDPRTG
ncbi:hypothetical protein [Streptomyces sp. NPDC093707]|uniref:hypothetical protein n=1 Tax=Streptomyces sp. NPDC093707 TaxID=3154984 RepID=UPI00344D5563